jgi:hypothetical protein
MGRLSKRIVASVGALLLMTSVAGAAEDKPEAAKDQAAEQKPKKHSKAKGAIVGGVGGAVVGGKKGAAVGAAGGALYQHHKNKKEAKEAQKAEKKQDQ